LPLAAGCIEEENIRPGGGLELPGHRPSGPDIRCFPARDDAFRADVQQAVTRSRETISAGQRLVEAVRRDLAARYPKVVIREQDALAGLGTDDERWYVYRDGRIA
jgi:hypothetical protein